MGNRTAVQLSLWGLAHPVYSQAWVGQWMMGVFIDFEGYYGNPVVQSCGVEWPNLDRHLGAFGEERAAVLRSHRLAAGKGPKREEQDFTWRRRWSPNSANRPMNRGDDSLPTRRAPMTANSPNGGNPMKTEVSRIPAESPLSIG